MQCCPQLKGRSTITVSVVPCPTSPPGAPLTIPLLDSWRCGLHCSEARKEESSEETGAHLET